MNPNVLVAEDDLNFRESLAGGLGSFCRDLNLTIVTASTREEALSIIASLDDISVVLTDLRMPAIGDGEAVANAALDRGIRVIILSGTLSDLREATRSRCFGVLDKERCTVRDVAALIRTSLQAS